MIHLGGFVLVLTQAMIFTLMMMPGAIDALRRLKAGQVIQDEGPQTHQSKAGTPTMGGLVILLAALAIPGYLAYIFSSAREKIGHPGSVSAFWALAVIVVVYAVIGAIDDWLTIRPKRGRRGISSKAKFGLQFVAAVIFVLWLHRIGWIDPVVRLGRDFSLDLGWMYIPLAVIFITGMANFINITDGLDGLAAGLTAILAATLAIVPFLVGSGERCEPFSLLLLGFVGACLGFLWFNFNPAKVFMGDTGSLAIGALIPAVAIVGKMEIPMIIAGMVFILDGLSSAVQWAVFKYTRIRTGTGKRVFRMSPVHHHFELSGWPEQLVVVRFWIVGGLFALVAVWLSIGS